MASSTLGSGAKDFGVGGLRKLTKKEQQELQLQVLNWMRPLAVGWCLEDTLILKYFHHGSNRTGEWALLRQFPGALLDHAVSPACRNKMTKPLLEGEIGFIRVTRTLALFSHNMKTDIENNET